MIIYSPSDTLKHLSEAMKYSFRCDQQKMLAGRKVAVRMIAIIAKMVIMIKIKMLL